MKTAEYARQREWYDTEVGKLFIRFENALGRAWQSDCREGLSDIRLKRDWEAANKARADLLKAIRGW